MALDGPGITDLTTCSGGECRRVNFRPGGGILMVPEGPDSLEIGRIGFFGGSFHVTKLGLPERNACPAGKHSSSSTGFATWLVATHDPGG